MIVLGFRGKGSVVYLERMDELFEEDMCNAIVGIDWYPF